MERNNALHDVIDAICRAILAVCYIRLADSMREFDESRVSSALSVSADE